MCFRFFVAYAPQNDSRVVQRALKNSVLCPYPVNLTAA